MLGLEKLEAIVGVPFHDEDDTLPGVVRTAREGLLAMGLAGRSAVVCVGPEIGRDALEAAVGEDSVPARGFLLGRGIEGRGWCVRAIMEAAARSGAALVLLPPGLAPQDGDEAGEGYSPSWIPRLLGPVRDQAQDLVLARFSRHPLANSVESLLVFPIVTGVFGLRLRQPTPGVYALSYRLTRLCLASEDDWHVESGIHGFDPWLTTCAIVKGVPMCVVPLGVASFRHEFGKLKRIFRQVAHTLLGEVVKHDDWCLERSGLVSTPPVSGPMLDVSPPPFVLEEVDMARHSKMEFDHFDDTLFRQIIPDDFRERMERMTDSGSAGMRCTPEEWARVLNEFLLSFSFEQDFHPDDIVDGLFPFFLGRLSTYADEVRKLELGFQGEDAERIVRHEAERILEQQADLLVGSWPELRRAWMERRTESTPYLPRLGSWEFVPHVGVIVPQEIKTAEEPVRANKVYQQLIDRYRSEFTAFLSESLGIDGVTDSQEILLAVHQFMHKLDWALSLHLFPYDLATVDGTRSMVEAVCRDFCEGRCYQLTPDAATSILKQTPPGHLIMQLGCRNVGGLLNVMDPCDALGAAAWTDRQHYLERVLDIIGKDAKPGWFHDAPIKPVVVDLNYMTNPTELRGSASLSRMAGRLMAGNLQKGGGGEFPRLWYFLNLIKRIVGIELFARIWKGLAEEDIDFGPRMVSSIRGHWGRRVLSAHNIFENLHQRILVDRLRRFARETAERDPTKRDIASLLEAAADVYHLSITLPDATFVPLSAWTWTSYSHRGGLGAPTPLSSLVERDWATRDFLTAYMEAAGIGDGRTVDAKVLELVGLGQEPESLSKHLLGVSADPDELMVTQTPSVVPLPAGRLERPVDGPILEPLDGHPWESRYVLNAAAVRLDGAVHILYRAYGDDEISRIGLAWSRDGIHIDGRLEEPVFVPADATESAGCEDPRVTVIGDRMYMLYTAWDGQLHQIAMASIDVQAFLEHRFDAWKRHGLGFPGLTNKDAVLYPEEFDGRYVLYHRIDPNMWISYLDDLECPWPRTGHRIVVGPRPGMMWDGVKIGAGAQPIKTTHGWLNIYHGVDYERSYRLGVLFMDSHDPATVIYQSPNPILEPETEFEIGGSGRDYWVPHVVFTCGAVPATQKDVVGLDDEILVYYGAADTAIGVAKGRLRDMVPVLIDGEQGK